MLNSCSFYLLLEGDEGTKLSQVYYTMHDPSSTIMRKFLVSHLFMALLIRCDMKYVTYILGFGVLNHEISCMSDAH